nr:LysR substrate-binding domain-containing protein [Aeromonas caviae]
MPPRATYWSPAGASLTAPSTRSSQARGRRRTITTLVPGFATALALVRESNLVATVPHLHCASLLGDLVTLPLPFALPGIRVALLWHPSQDADPGHRWLRALIRDTCARPPYHTGATDTP